LDSEVDGVSRWPVQKLYRRWKMHGRLALVSKCSKASYSFEFKLLAVQRFLSGELAAQLATELGLSSPVLLRTWARVYRREGEDGLRPKPGGRPPGTADSAPERDSELDRLRQENARLQAEIAFLGKVRALSERRPR
ncbi:transposase, partial [Amycolatopsis sp. NPDC004368]